MKTITYAFLLACALALSACAGSGQPQSVQSGAAPIKCDRTEEDGCIEFDVLNMTYDPSHPVMAGLDRPPQNEDERYDRVVNLGPKVYKAWKNGEVKPAASKTITFYMWDVDGTPTDYMSEYRLKDTKGTVSRHDVNEVAPNLGATFDPAFDLGEPDRAFAIEVKTGTGLQIPWSMIGPRTYVLACSNDSDTVHPNRITANDGLWLTPEYLNAIRDRGWDYVLMAFLSK